MILGSRSSGFRSRALGFKVWGFGLRASGLGFLFWIHLCGSQHRDVFHSKTNTEPGRVGPCQNAQHVEAQVVTNVVVLDSSLNCGVAYLK